MAKQITTGEPSSTVRGTVRADASHHGCPDHRTVQAPTRRVLTTTIITYTSRAGITAAAGTRLALDLLISGGFRPTSFQLHAHLGLALVVLVTFSKCLHRKIFAPAAWLTTGRHLSGGLSRIRPKSSVTHHNLGKPLFYQQSIKGQNAKGPIDGSRPFDSLSCHESPRVSAAEATRWFSV